MRGTCCLFFFFFSSRRRHTRSLCDWSSDVCSSDLGDQAEQPETSGVSQSGEAAGQLASFRFIERLGEDRRAAIIQPPGGGLSDRQPAPPGHLTILTSVDEFGKMRVSTHINASEGKLTVAIT